MTGRIERAPGGVGHGRRRRAAGGRARGDLTGAPADAERLERARRLFAQVLELPRGLGVMTIHALCGALLRRFPLEAGVAPHFETIDERTAGELLREAREQVLRQARTRATAARPGAAGPGRDAGGGRARRGARRAAGPAAAAAAARAASGDALEAMLAGIARALGTEPGHEPADAGRAGLRRRRVRCARPARDAAQALAGGSDRRCRARPRHRASGSTAAPERSSATAARLSALLPQGRRAAGCRPLATKKVAAEPRRCRRSAHEQARLCGCATSCAACCWRGARQALLRVALAVIDAYEALKERSAALDYDDLIERTRRLLATARAARMGALQARRAASTTCWSTRRRTPARQQWEVILQADRGILCRRGRPRAPADAVRGRRREAVDLQFPGCRPRQLPAGPRVADQPGRGRANADPRRAAGSLVPLGRRPCWPPSTPCSRCPRRDRRGRGRGRAAVTPPSAPTRRGWSSCGPWRGPPPPTCDEPWPLPDNPRPNDEPERRIARAIAGTVRRWLDRGEILEAPASGPAGRHPDPAGRRGILQERLVRALKQAGVPVAGADRLALTEHIAGPGPGGARPRVLLPEDDLNLACLLKSPLLGLDEGDCSSSPGIAATRA